MLGIFVLLRIMRRGTRSFAADEKSRAVLLLAVGLIGAGGLFYRNVEDLSWVDSFYFTIVTLTTAGYGDIAPQTTAGKLFTSIYLLVGIGVLVALATEVARHLIDSGSKRQGQKRAG